jgi:hypothetical protein
MDALSISQGTEVLVRWRRAENRKILRRVAKKDCSAAQLRELSRRAEGEELRTEEAGGKNFRHASA